jgi:hypothetical protein
MIRFFDGYASERIAELDERKLRRPLVKTQILEMLVSGPRAMEYERERRERELIHLNRRAKKLGYTLIPVAAPQPAPAP